MTDYVVSIAITGDSRSAEQAFQRLSRAVKQSDTDVQRSSQSNRNLVTSLNSIERAVAGAYSAFVGAQAFQVLQFFNDLGVKSRDQGALFAVLAGGSDNARASLDRMRASTRGLADDLTLVSGANQILNLKLASNVQDAEKLVTLISRLKKPDLTMDQAVGDFSMLLANSSYLRLDQWGLNADMIRARVGELEAAGMAEGASFTAAVIEGLESKNNELSAALDKQATSMRRVGARFQNVGEWLGNRVAEGVEAGFQLIEISILQLEAMLDAHDRYWEERNRELADAQGQQQLSSNIVTSATEAANAALGEEFLPYYAQAGQSAGQAFNEALVAEILNIAKSQEGLTAGDILDISGLGMGLYDDAERAAYEGAIRAILGTEERITGEARAQVAAQREVNDELARANAMLARNRDEQQWAATLAADQAAAAAQFPAFDSATSYYSQVMQLAYGQQHGERNGLQLWTPQDAAEVARIKGEFEEVKERLEDLHEAGELPDSLMQAAEGYADAIGQIADEAKRGAENVSSLRELLGQQTGGVGVDMRNALLDYMEANGATDADLEAAQRAYDLQFGVITPQSELFEQEILPMLDLIRMVQGPEASATAAQSFWQNLELAQQSGLNLPLEAYPSLTGYQFGATDFAGAEFFINGRPRINPTLLDQYQQAQAQGPTDAALALSQQLGVAVTPEQIAAYAGMSGPRLPGAPQDAERMAFDMVAQQWYANGMTAPEGQAVTDDPRFQQAVAELKDLIWASATTNSQPPSGIFTGEGAASWYLRNSGFDVNPGYFAYAAGSSNPNRLPAGNYALPGPLQAVDPMQTLQQYGLGGEGATDVSGLEQSMSNIARDAMTHSEALQFTSGYYETVAGLTPGIATDVESMAGDATTIKSDIDEAYKTFEEMTETEYEIKLKFSIEAERIIKDWIKSEVVSINRGSGGTSPGVDARRTRSAD